MSFWDSFKSAIHDNPQLTKVEKFNYLLGLLDGAAAHSQDNYDAAAIQPPTKNHFCTHGGAYED